MTKKINLLKILLHFLLILYLMYCGFITAGAGEGIFYPFVLFWSPGYFIIPISKIIKVNDGIIFVIIILLNIIYWIVLLYRIYYKKGKNLLNFILLIGTYVLSIAFIIFIPDNHSNGELNSVIKYCYFYYFSGFLLYLILNIILIKKLIKRHFA